MASTAEDLLSCSICLEHFQDPRLLHCGHTFCKQCLTEYVNKDARGYHAHVSCPQCRTMTQLDQGQIESLPKDFRIGQFQDIISQSEDKKKTKQTFCVLCREHNVTTEASRLCTDCKRDFCEPCAQRHSDVPAFKDHRIITMPTGETASLRFCGSHFEELLMYSCRTCEQFVCSLCITDTHNQCEVHSVTESLEENHKKLSAVSTPLLANEDTLNSYLRDYNIRVEKMNEAHDAIDRHANRLVDHIKKVRKKLQRDLATYEQEQMAKLLTSFSADGSVDVHSYKQLCTDIQKLTASNDPWTVAMQTTDIVAKATNVNQALDRLKKSNDGTELQCMAFTPESDKLDFGTLDLTTIDEKERQNYPGYRGETAAFRGSFALQQSSKATDLEQTSAVPAPSTASQIWRPAATVSSAPNTSHSMSNLNNVMTQPNPTNHPPNGFPFAMRSDHTPEQMFMPPQQPAPPPYRMAHTSAPQPLYQPGKHKRTYSDSSSFEPYGKIRLKPDFMNRPAPVPLVSVPGPSFSGIVVSGLPPDAEKQAVLEIFGFDVVRQIVVKDGFRPGAFGNNHRVAFILYTSPYTAALAVQQLHQKPVLGAIVQVQLCDENLVLQEATGNAPGTPQAPMTVPNHPANIAPVPLIDISASPPASGFAIQNQRVRKQTEKGKFALCRSCGMQSADYNRCEGCNKEMPDEPKFIFWPEYQPPQKKVRTVQKLWNAEYERYHHSEGCNKEMPAELEYQPRKVTVPLTAREPHDPQSPKGPSGQATTSFSQPSEFRPSKQLSASLAPLDLRAIRVSGSIRTSTVTSADQPQPSTSTATSPVKSPLKMKFKRSRSKSSTSDGQADDAYQIVPCRSSPETPLDLLENLPEPRQNVDEASGALSLLDIINNTPPASAHSESDWTCPNCGNLNACFESPCDCGEVTPNMVETTTELK